MIDSNGVCVPNTTASTDLNFRRAFALNLTLPAARETNSLALSTIQEWEFPALEVTYCPTGDAVCNSCIQEEFWFSTSDSRFCVGSGGCVCILTCEIFPLQGPPCSSIPAVTTRMTPPIAPTPTPSIAKSDYLEPDSAEWWDHVSKRMIILTVCCILACVLCSCICAGLCRHKSRRRPRQRRLINDTVTATPTDETPASTTSNIKDKAAYREMQ
jgi:hypothetical protein